jgi:hypothetical protein
MNTGKESVANAEFGLRIAEWKARCPGCHFAPLKVSSADNTLVSAMNAETSA